MLEIVLVQGSSRFCPLKIKITQFPNNNNNNNNNNMRCQLSLLAVNSVNG